MRIYENNVYIYIYIYLHNAHCVYIYKNKCIHIIHAYIYMPHIITSTQDIWEWDNMGYRTNNLWLAESPDGRDIPFFGGDDGMEI